MTDLTSKQRSFLMGQAQKLSPIFRIGKGGVTPEYTEAIREALESNELIKINFLKNNTGDKYEIANLLAERTSSRVVAVIGNKIILFKYQNDPKKRKINI